MQMGMGRAVAAAPVQAGEEYKRTKDEMERVWLG